MSRRGSGSRWTLDEKNWSQPWWIPLTAVVLAAVTWGLLGLVEGGCRTGPRGGCVAAEGYRLNGWVLFLAAMPTYFVVVTGLVTDRWPPALGLTLGGAGCAAYVLTQGRTPAHWAITGALLALAALAPALTWWRKRQAASLTP
ncbi:hypothetical protein [Streptomyces sp. NRRL B-24572]|uniref:hypothetical protein n=1 Tax=Streptomyces sp. NRRL B-24572 TaxID=1962156 RepID=UPI000A3819BE|nr:hypothetical protein [Streptomyces sp. NRRL B-24572]